MAQYDMYRNTIVVDIIQIYRDIFLRNRYDRMKVKSIRSTDCRGESVF
jgi:hypothetical protein